MWLEKPEIFTSDLCKQNKSIYINSTEKVNDGEKQRQTWRNGPSWSRHLHQQVLGYMQLFLTPTYPCSSGGLQPSGSCLSLQALVHLHQGET